MNAPRTRIVIIGAGFGGLEAARALSKSEVDITLIDRRNFHLFQPLLYQVATAALSPGELTYRWRLVDLYLNTSRAEKMLAELGYLAEHLPSDTRTQEWYRSYKQAYDFSKD